MPDHPAALALLARTGPMAVSSANRTGQRAALTATEAQAQLGASVQVYLDGGMAPGGVASTIVDATGDVLRIVRDGALSLDELCSVAPVEPLAAAAAPGATEPTAEPQPPVRPEAPAGPQAAGVHEAEDDAR
jgi:hypothetical protein